SGIDALRRDEAQRTNEKPARVGRIDDVVDGELSRERERRVIITDLREVLVERRRSVALFLHDRRRALVTHRPELGGGPRGEDDRIEWPCSHGEVAEAHALA